MKVKILSDRLVGYKVGQKVDVGKLDGVNVHQWVRCGLAEYDRRAAVDVEHTDDSTEEGDD